MQSRRDQITSLSPFYCTHDVVSCCLEKRLNRPTTITCVASLVAPHPSMCASQDATTMLFSSHPFLSRSHSPQPNIPLSTDWRQCCLHPNKKHTCPRVYTPTKNTCGARGLHPNPNIAVQQDKGFCLGRWNYNKHQQREIVCNPTLHATRSYTEIHPPRLVTSSPLCTTSPPFPHHSKATLTKFPIPLNAIHHTDTHTHTTDGMVCPRCTETTPAALETQR